MNRSLHSVPDGEDDAELSIGDLAERTGLTTATLRVWETRYGFPAPQRRASGHRRYTGHDVELVSEVVARRDAGVRLDVAIDQVLNAEIPAPPQAVRGASAASAFSRLRRSHPVLQAQRLRKSTLLAMTRAIEDEFCARAERAHLFGAFQKQGYYGASQQRWEELASLSATAYAFADFDDTRAGTPSLVRLPDGSPMRREWSVVCDSADLCAVLAAWELPGQQRAADADRVFEAVWSVDPTAVREASRVCADVALAEAADGAEELVRELAGRPASDVVDTTALTSLLNRVLAYVDSPPHR